MRVAISFLGAEPLFVECAHKHVIEEGRRKKEEGRRKKEEGRRKKEEGVIAMVSAIKNVLTVLAVAGCYKSVFAELL
ncbi:hypothetical protein Q5692_20700 [Microcoleus sp. C2C3]|uniref:hypothetical protein n=1 Tax=unclassified Microcoleus TaxID=2642155 RepID=UPI002FD2260A